jgi:serine/threonine protein kinase
MLGILNADGFPKVKDYVGKSLVMEYIEGKNLQELMEEGRRFTMKEILYLMEEILRLLNILHKQEPPMIYRDMKPANVMIGRNGKVYLIDFGTVYSREIEEGANVFKVKAIEGGVLAAGLPVILQAEKAGTYYFKINYAPTLVTDEDKRETYSVDGEEVDNLLEGCHATTYIPERSGYTHYILANKEQGVGMYKVITYDALTSKDGVTTTFDISSFQNNAHRAWLPMADVDSQRAPGYVFSIGRGKGNTTDVEEIESEKNDEKVIYDLQGRRLEKIIHPGIYIVNGERALVK